MSEGSADKRVLIVDDAAIIRRILKSIFLKNGITVAGEAADGQEAVDLYRELQPDVVTMDITMPVMDGLKATETILGEFPQARIIMVSSVGQEQVIKEAISLGALDFIVKPLKEEQLINTVRRVIDN